MKHKIVSGLGVFLSLPVFAGARLPAVNVASAAVSARAQYGLPAKVAANKAELTTEKPAVVKRQVVARTAKRSAVSAPAKDTGEKIAATQEFLVPNRPSSNLWAKNEAPLRMPHADEFSVITSDVLLPEESIDGPTYGTTNSFIADARAKTAALDSQLEKFIEMQRKAEASVASNTVREIVPKVDDGVRLSRLVVPREDSVQSNDAVRATRKDAATKIKETREDMTKMSPAELRRAFRKTFLSENKHLSTYPIDDRFDVASDIGSYTEGFTSARDLSEDADKIRALEIKIKFRNEDSSLSRDNYNLLSEYAGTVVANPKRAIQVAIPVSATETSAARKLAARRLAIVEQVLRDTGVSEQRIVPVLSERNEEGFVLRIISNEQFETLTRQKRNMFGDTTSSKTYRSMSW
ncbi:MAG: hypothetical protein J5611_02275 [Alphaproteobacteria bacterium]|nr:hypothetical protein [Alphaproteobacteria bacterium]